MKKNLSNFRNNSDLNKYSSNVYLTIVIPIYNEKESLPFLFEQVFSFVDGLNFNYEVIAVNDGSSDGSEQVLKDFASLHKNLKVINFRRNYGQTAAIMAGIDFSEGDVIVSIDADLQNDIRDLPNLIAKIDEGFDVVSGWRQSRKDDPIRRNFVSRIANWLISFVSGVTLHDYGCTLKAYSRDIIKNVRLYGEMHRFIPIYAYWEGAKVIEIPVKHHSRKFGRSKYGLERSLKVILDLMVVKFLHQYHTKPIYVFGSIGFLFIIFSTLAFFFMLYIKFSLGISMIKTPLPLLSAVTFLVGVVSILMGLLAEIMVRTYYESQGKRTYSVRSALNMNTD